MSEKMNDKKLKNNSSNISISFASNVSSNANASDASGASGASSDATAKKRGSPYKYISHVEPRLDEVYEWIKKGYTDYSIAENLGVSHLSYQEYKKDNIALASLYTRAIKERNTLVYNSMLMKAAGHTATVKQQKLTKTGEIIELSSEIYVPPDPNAADLFLRNRDVEYKSAKAAEISGVSVNILSVPEQRRIIAEVLQQDLKASEPEPAIEAEYKLILGDPEERRNDEI